MRTALRTVRRRRQLLALADSIVPLTLVRGYGFDCGREPSMNFRVNRLMPDLGARGILAKEVVAFPVLRRSDGPWNESPAAVRAHVLQDVFDARRTKCALVGAIRASSELGGKALLQFSQVGLSSSMRPRLIGDG